MLINAMVICASMLASPDAGIADFRPDVPEAQVFWNAHDAQWEVAYEADCNRAEAKKRILGLSEGDRVFEVRMAFNMPETIIVHATGELEILSCGCVGTFSDCGHTCSDDDCNNKVGCGKAKPDGSCDDQAQCKWH